MKYLYTLACLLLGGLFLGPYVASAVTTTEGSDGTSGVWADPPQLDYESGKVFCSQSARGPRIVFPHGTGTFNSCSSSTVAAMDICTTTPEAGGCPAAGTDSKINIDWLPSSVLTSVGTHTHTETNVIAADTGTSTLNRLTKWTSPPHPCNGVTYNGTPVVVGPGDLVCGIGSTWYRCDGDEAWTAMGGSCTENTPSRYTLGVSGVQESAVSDNTRYAMGPIVFGDPSTTEYRTYTSVATGTATGTGSGDTQTSTQTWTATSGVTVTESATLTYAWTEAITETDTWTRSADYGSPPNGYQLRTTTSDSTKTLTGTITATATSLAIGGTITLTGTNTGTGTSTVTVTGQRTSTISSVLPVTASGTGTRSAYSTLTFTGTRTRTSATSGSYTGTATYAGSVTGTSTASGSLTYTQTDYATATTTNKNSDHIVSSTLTSVYPIINAASFNTQTVTTPSGGTKTWTQTLSLTGTDVCKSSPGSGDIPCLGTDSKFATSVIPPSTDIVRAGANVWLTTGTATDTLSQANVKDIVKVHASPSATATTTAIATHTFRSVNSNLVYCTDDNCTSTATVTSVTSDARLFVVGHTTSEAFGLAQMGAGGKLDSGMLNTATASSVSKIVQSRTDGKIDTSFLPGFVLQATYVGTNYSEVSTSTAWTEVVSITYSGFGAVMAWGTMRVRGTGENGGGHCGARIQVDSETVGPPSIDQYMGPYNTRMSLSPIAHKGSLTAGWHTVALQVATQGATCVVDAGDGYLMIQAILQ